jgi:hypothetical protein
VAQDEINKTKREPDERKENAVKEGGKDGKIGMIKEHFSLFFKIQNETRKSNSRNMKVYHFNGSTRIGLSLPNSVSQLHACLSASLSPDSNRYKHYHYELHKNLRN